MKRGQIYYVRSNYREEGSEQRGAPRSGNDGFMSAGDDSELPFV